MDDIPLENKECIFRPSFMQLLQKKNIFDGYPKPKHLTMINDAIRNHQVERILDNTYGISVPLNAKLCRIWLKYATTVVHIIAFEYPEIIHPQDAFKGDIS